MVRLDTKPQKRFSEIAVLFGMNIRDGLITPSHGAERTSIQYKHDNF